MDGLQRHKTKHKAALSRAAMFSNGTYLDKGLLSAWDSMDKAKSALRHAEHRLTDIENPVVGDVLWNLPGYLFDMIEHDNLSHIAEKQNTSIPQFYDNTSRQSVNRKINKPVVMRSDISQHSKDVSASSSHNASVKFAKKSYTSGSRDDSVANLRHTTSFGSDSHLEPSFSSMPTSANFSRASQSSAASKSFSSSVQDMTSSTAVRETDIQFINDVRPVRERPLSTSQPARLHRVNVVVPVARQEVVERSNNMSRPTGQPSKPRVTFEDQRTLDRAPPTRDVSNSSSDSNSLEQIRLRLKEGHREDNRQIVTGIDEDVDSSVVPVRKIALGPQLLPPSYKGFNEPAAARLDKASLSEMDKIKLKSEQSHVTYCQKPELLAGSTHGPARSVAPLTDGIAGKDFITTSTWRHGAKLVQQDLGVSLTGAPSTPPPVKKSRRPAREIDQDDEGNQSTSATQSGDARLRNLVRIDSDAPSHVQERVQKTERRHKGSLKKFQEHSDHETTQSKVRRQPERPDSTEVRQFMKKRREEQLHRERQESETRVRDQTAKKQKLDELRQKQLEIVAASVAVSRQKAVKQKQFDESSKENATANDVLYETMSCESDSELNSYRNNPAHAKHRTPQRVENVARKSKAGRVEQHANANDSSTEYIHHQQQQRQGIGRRAVGSSLFVDSNQPAANGLPGDVGDDMDSDRSLSAEQIVSRFAENAGLSLQDVISNYSQYAQKIQMSFTHRGSVHVREPTDGKEMASTSSARNRLLRLKALQTSSALIQSRLQKATLNIQSDLQKHVQSLPASEPDVVESMTLVRSSDQQVESTIPGYMGPQADGRVQMLDKPTVVTTVERTTTNIVLPSSKDVGNNNNNTVRRKATTTHVVLSDFTCPSHAVSFGASQPQPMPFDPYILKPVHPVIAWEQQLQQPDPYNVFSILHRTHTSVEMYPNKYRLDNGDKGEDAGISPIGLATVDHISRSQMMMHRGAELDRTSNVTDDNSESMWSATSMSGKEHDVVVGKSAMKAGPTTSDRAVSVKSQPVWPAAESAPVSYRDDFTDVSETLMGTDFHRSVSLRPNAKVDDDVTGMELIGSPVLSDELDTDTSEFPEISSLTSGQQAVSLSLHHPATSSAHIFTQGYVTRPVVPPAMLDLRMALELNRLDMIGDSLLQVTNIERTQAVSSAQQETVALAQVLKGREQKAAFDIAAAKQKADEEKLEMAHKITVSKHLDAAQTMAQTAAEMSATLRESARIQGDMARITADASGHIAKMSDKVLEQQQHRDVDVETTQRMLMESAAMAAASAVAGIVERYHLHPQKPYEAVSSTSQQKTRPKSPVSGRLSDRSQPTSLSARSDERSNNRSVSSVGKSGSRTVAVESEKPRSDLVELQRTDSKRLSKSRGTSDRPSEVTDDVSTAVDTDFSSKQQKTSKGSKKQMDSSESTGSDVSEVHTATDLSVKSTSVISEASNIRTATNQSRSSYDYGKSRQVQEKTDQSSIASKSVADSSIVKTAADESIQEEPAHDTSVSSVQTDTATRSPTVRRHSIISGQQSNDDEKADYTLDYDTTMTEDELEKSLREIVPSEGQRKKIRHKKLLNTSTGEIEMPGVAFLCDHVSDDDSFTRFNVAMVLQYFKEEAVHQQHKHTMILLRERALKEKTAVELACLEQMKQQLRDKGTDDKHPDIIRKEKAIRRNHQQRQEELNRLKEASKLALEKQQQMIKETAELSELHRSTQQAREKLKRDGLDALMLMSPDVTIDDIAPLVQADGKANVSANGGGDLLAGKETLKLNLKKDKKYLTAREQQLQERRRKVSEKLDISEQLSRKEKEIQLLEQKSKQLIQQRKDSLKNAGDSSLHEATSLLTDRHDADTLDTARTKPPASILEDLPSEPTTARSKARSSIAEELPSSARRSSAALSESGKYSSHQDSATEESSITEQISDEVKSAADASVADRSDAPDYGNDDFESYTERTAARGDSEKDASSKRSTPRSVATKTQSKPVQRQTSFGAESDTSLNRSDVTSDQSDLENRIQNLTQQLKKCKAEAESLKREQRRQRKMKLRAEERSLQQQIEMYDSYIRRVKAEMIPSSPKASRDSDTVKLTSTPVKTGVELQKKPLAESSSKLPSSDSSGSELTVVPDVNKRNRSLSEKFEVDDKRMKKVKEIDERPVKKQGDKSESITEDIPTAVDDASSVKLNLNRSADERQLLKLDLGASSEHFHAASTPRAPAIDSARTMADVSESLAPTNRDESSAAYTQKRDTTHQASVASGVNSYADDFSSTVDATDGKLKNSIPKAASSIQTEESIATEDDVSEATLSDGDEVVARSVGEDKSVKMHDGSFEGADDRAVKSDKDDEDLVASQPKQLPEAKAQPVADYAQAVDSAISGLVSEAIGQMIDIKKSKLASLPPIPSVVAPADDAKPFGVVHSPTQHSVGTSTDLPLFPAVSDPKDDLDDIYNELSTLKPDDDWLLPSSRSSKPVAKQATGRPTSSPKQPIIHVPHNNADVVQLVESAVDALWPNRFDAKTRSDVLRLSLASLDDLAGSGTDNVEQRSREVYQRLVFDLTSQALSELYRDSASAIDASTQPWLQPGLRVRPAMPVTAADAKPQICNAVLQWLGLSSSKSGASSRHGRSRGIRTGRTDRVDELLQAELRQEDAEWADYTNDELFVKMQLADVLFDMLLGETTSILSNVTRRRTGSVAWLS